MDRALEIHDFLDGGSDRFLGCLFWQIVQRLDVARNHNVPGFKGGPDTGEAFRRGFGSFACLRVPGGFHSLHGGGPDAFDSFLVVPRRLSAGLRHELLYHRSPEICRRSGGFTVAYVRQHNEDRVGRSHGFQRRESIPVRPAIPDQSELVPVDAHQPLGIIGAERVAQGAQALRNYTQLRLHICVAINLRGFPLNLIELVQDVRPVKFSSQMLREHFLNVRVQAFCEQMQG